MLSTFERNPLGSMWAAADVGDIHDINDIHLIPFVCALLLVLGADKIRLMDGLIDTLQVVT